MQYYSSYPIDEFDVSEASVYNDCASPKAHIMQNKVTTFTRTNDTKQSRPICANVRSRNLHINELACSDSTRREEMPVDVAFETVRKVVYIIISAKTIQCETKQNQLDALANEKIQPRKALAKFVRNGGLISINELMAAWNGNAESTDRVLFLLKILAILPGISAQAISASKIGRKLKRVTSQQIYPPEVKGLAEWIIAKWKVDILPASDRKSKRIYSERSIDGDTLPTVDIKPSPEDSKPHSATEKVQVNKISGVGKSMAKASSALLPNKRKVDILGIALNSGKYRKTNANLHQVQRRSKLIQTLKDRQKSIKDVGDILSTIIGDWKAAKVRFGDSTVVDFDRSQVVCQMMSTTKCGPRLKNSAGIPKPGKSILKVMGSRSEHQLLCTSPCVYSGSAKSIGSRGLDGTTNFAVKEKKSEETRDHTPPTWSNNLYQTTKCAEPSLCSSVRS